MFWRVSSLTTTSPVETILAKESFTLEELFDEDELIQECKALNNRLMNFLRGKDQVKQMLHYIVEEPPENADSRRAFNRFPFLACEVFSCEIEGVFKTLLEDQELMDLLFSFLEPDRSHSTLLAGYFSKVVICLLVRKTGPIVEYIQAHQEILCRLVDLIGITSIMEILIRLVGAEDHMYSESSESMQWLADTNLLEMLVDKLSSSNTPETHTNAAETLCTITRLAPSALSLKLSSPSFVGRLFHHALEDSQSNSTLVHSLSVCISVLDPKKAMVIAAANSSRGHVNEPALTANPETVDGMLQRIGDLVKLLDVSSDEKVLPTTYGELRPPLGKHRLKIVEFIAVLLRTGSHIVQQELVKLDAIKKVIELFFDYPFNNSLHHQVESIVMSCLESANEQLIDHLLQDCNLIGRILIADKNPLVCVDENKPTVPTPDKVQPRVGNIGHLTHIANKLNQMAINNSQIQSALQANDEWKPWETTVLSKRNMVENVGQWACGRPTTIHERPIDSDEDEFRDKDYDVSAMANNLSQVFRYGIFDNEDGEEIHANLEKDDEDVFFDDESAEMVVSSLRMGEEQDSARLRETMFSNTNWFAFHDDRPSEQSTSFGTSPPTADDNQINTTTITANNVGSSGSDDDVVVGDDEELVDTATSHSPNAIVFEADFGNGSAQNGSDVSVNDTDSGRPVEDLSRDLGKVDISENLSYIQCVERGMDLFSVKSSDWAEWKDNADVEGTSGRNPFSGNNPFEMEICNSPRESDEVSSPSGNQDLKMDVEETGKQNIDASVAGSHSPEVDAAEEKKSLSLFEENVEFVGVDLEGTKKAMEHALKEGIVGEAGPMKRDSGMRSPNASSPKASDENGDAKFNDNNYWRGDLSPAILQEDSL